MKKINLNFIILSFSLMIFSNSYSQAFEEGNTVISLGYGMPNLNKSIFNVFNTEKDFKISGYGPLHAKVEYGVSDKIGLGLSINHVAAGISYRSDDANNYNYDLNWNSTKFNARMNIHFANSDKLDAYWGFGFGYGFNNAKWKSNDPDFVDNSFKNPIGIGFETTLGARYYITDNFGLYSEVGLAKSLVQFGLCLKL